MRRINSLKPMNCSILALAKVSLARGFPTPVLTAVFVGLIAATMASPELAWGQRRGPTRFQNEGPSNISPNRTGASPNTSAPGSSAGPRGPSAGGVDPRVGPRGEGLEARSRFVEGGCVGRDAEDVRDTLRTMSRGEQRRAMFDVVIENLNEMREARRRAEAERYVPPAVRVRLQPIFTYVRPADADLQAVLQTRFDRTLPTRGDSVSVDMRDGVVVLRGAAVSERDRRLAEQMAALQPGVSRVENRIVVTDQ